MASSSRAKKQCTSVTTKKQGTSSSEANPLNLARLLVNDEQRKQNLFAFCEESNAYYPELVGVFYYNLNLRKNLLISLVNGKEIILDMQTFSSICSNIPYHGSIKDFGLACDWDNYDRKEFYYSLCRFSKEEIDLRKKMALGLTVKNRDILVVGNLNLEDRLLHYFLSYIIMPKFSNHSQINDIELKLIYALKHNLEINWALTVMRHMWSVRETNSPLPYAIII
ncbi:hypothetical protein Lal_00027202 [Lupinus albus]|nr:hypothetical protein Lal_00027202 [Lupinus albus]